MTRHLWMSMCAALLAAGVVRAEEAASGEAGNAPRIPTGTISAGLTLNSGNSDAKTADVGLESEYNTGAHEWRLAASTAYGEKNSEKSVDNSKAKLNYHRLLNSHAFWFGEGSYSRDSIADVSYRYVLSTGPGYYFIKGESLSLSGEFGPGYLWEEVGGVADDMLTLRVAERLEWQFSEEAKLWQSCEYLPTMDDFGDYLVNTEIGAEAPLAGRLSLRLLAKHTHDSTPAEGREKNDLSIIAGVGFGF